MLKTCATYVFFVFNKLQLMLVIFIKFAMKNIYAIKQYYMPAVINSDFDSRDLQSFEIQFESDDSIRK